MKSLKLREKDLAKVLSKDRARKRATAIELASLTGLSKIDFDIGELKRQISSCKYDLEHACKKSFPAQCKLKLLEDNLVKLELERKQFEVKV